MRNLALLVTVIAALLGSPSGQAGAMGPQIKDIVFDLDWTLFYSRDISTSVDKNAEVDPLLKHKNSIYQVSKSAVPVLLNLQEKGYRLSIFSGGDEQRNQQLVEWLQKEAKTQFNQELKFYKILGFRALTERSLDPGLKFSQRYGKDLKHINPNLEQIILIDDIRQFAVIGQERNLVHLDKTYNFIADYDSWSKSGSPHTSNEKSYDPPNYKEWIREQNKIERVLELIEQTEKLPNMIQNLQSLAIKEQCRYLLLD